LAETRRYRAISNVAYSHAIMALLQLARNWDGPEFSFGPADSLHALREQGLVVSGEDLSGVTDSLSKVAGLTEVPA
jgi:hypothetical protein